MQYDLTEEQRMLQNMVRRLAKEKAAETGEGQGE